MRQGIFMVFFKKIPKTFAVITDLRVFSSIQEKTRYEL
jgi:hypothetical protein